MQNMLKSVRDYLSGFGKVDDRVIEAMSRIDRKNFMPDDLKEKAYLDTAMPIGYGQTISQPSTVARMLSLLELKEGDKVLEIGTGSGWNAALISYLIGKGKVISLEKYDELIEQAGENIKRLKIENIEIAKKDFRDLKERFDKIIFTAGISSGQESTIEEFARNNLNEQGILIVPFRAGPLIIFKKIKGKLEKKCTEEEYVFVPLVL